MQKVARLNRVLLISHDVLGGTMAGPGIRYYHLARVLAQHVELTVAVPMQSSEQAALTFAGSRIRCVPYQRGDWHSIEGEAEQVDVIIFPSDTATDFPQLTDLDAALVVDGYDPLMAEWLMLDRAPEMAQRVSNWQGRLEQLRAQYLMGDFFICASERQRDWWLGLLEAHGRLNPRTVEADPSLRNLIEVVPYGLPDAPAQQTESVIRGIWPEISMTDQVVLWGGGLWPWLDPLTAIRAVAKLVDSHPTIRLIFPGTRHPSPEMAAMPSHVNAAKKLASELGIAGTHVIFGEWIPYADWVNVLLESDVALSLHFDTLETRLAFRSRVLEYIWTKRPIVTTRGDATSDLVAQYNLGAVVDYEDVDGVAQAVGHLLDARRNTRCESFESAMQQLTWDRVSQPLIDYCRAPHRAADRLSRGPAKGATFTGLPRADEATRQQELERLRRQVIGYESGRFMRMSRFVKTKLFRQAVGPLEKER